MREFLSELLRNLKRTYTVMLLDEEYREAPRTYQLRPWKVLALLGGTTLTCTFLLLALVIFTPARQLIPGYDTSEMEQEARLSALRLSALEDSLEVQQQYMAQLRRLLLGDFETADGETDPAPSGESYTPFPFDEDEEVRSDDWADHATPALSFVRMPIRMQAGAEQQPAGHRYLSSLELPASPPVTGLVTRGYDPRSGHYGIDFAAEEGTMVRSVGDGHIILADWTHDGGYTIAVQHADGYVSVYKHNQRLLKRPGDRVRTQEAIALSGNTGEMSTGPHLHFELWQNGLAQDPRHYLVGL